MVWTAILVTLVLLLSAVHGMLLGRLRRAIHSDHSDAIKHSPGWAGSILVLSFIVIFLVLTKPLAA